MGAVFLSEQDWDDIMSPALGILLQQCGIASTFPQKLIWAAPKYQGLGAKHHFYLMLQKQLAVILLETHNMVPTPVTSSCSAQKTSVERPAVLVTLLIFRLLFLHPQRSRTVVSNSFFLDSPGWDFAFEDHLPQLVLQREHDICLTEFFLQVQPPKDTLRDLLQCCQFLGVHWLSDLATADGLAIHPSAWAGKRITRQFPIDYRARQPSHQSLHWNKWQSALSSLVISTRNLQLQNPLGL
jgi:hypothetical protein